MNNVLKDLIIGVIILVVGIMSVLESKGIVSIVKEPEDRSVEESNKLNKIENIFGKVCICLAFIFFFFAFALYTYKKTN